MEYDLNPKPPRIVHDTYYDTRENFLRDRRITFRTRRLSGNLLISTKSDVHRISGNVIRRKERELPWAYNTVRLIAKNLNLRVLPPSRLRLKRMPVSRTLAAMGLEAIQERTTRRDTRDIVRRSASQTSILAELAIDRVTYEFEKTKVRLSEVEIEVKAHGGLQTVREVANELLSKYRPFLETWSHGKFVTGLAIGKLLKTKKIQRYLADGELKPGAFPLIDRTLQSGMI